jgi:protease PrsW
LVKFIRNQIFMNVAFALLPVLLFLAFLFLLDSFKLVVKKLLLFSLAWGLVCALLAYVINTRMLGMFSLSFETFSRYFAPAVEELLKIVFIIILIRLKRVGFIIDAVIYGFAVGAGFALAENIFYLYTNPNPNLLVWIIRGLGTSIMHGGCTALFSLVMVGAKSRETSLGLSFLPALAAAYVVHSLFNHFYFNPIVQTIGIVILLPVLFVFIFNYNERQLQNWLEVEFASEIELLKMINKGQFQKTRSGQYLASLKSKFSPEVLVDMYCYFSTYLDLSVKAKRNIMLRECGLPPIKEPDVDNKLKELYQLRKQIGKTGELTLSPLIRMNYRELWKLKTLE